mmetsp:Transcript_21702/g.39612  ORF Transcript_21702/g.39612 Transcript_21702/m.39612 type:complete len:251 (-) Transcript_21702:1719-2471(-)
MEDSPSKVRIKQLTDRLLGLQSGLEGERQAKFEAFNARFKSIETRLDTSGVNSDNKYKLLRDQLNRVSEGLTQERHMRETLDERKGKELKLVENNLRIDLNLLKQARKDTEGKVLKVLDEKLYAIKVDLLKEKKLREEFESAQEQQLEETLERLLTFSDSEAVAREDSCSRISEVLVEETGKLENQLELDKKVREESISTMMQMLKDMQDRLLTEVKTEREERISTEATLLKLLEDTCVRVENSLRGSVV